MVELIDRDRLGIGRTQYGKQQVVIEALCVEVNLAAAGDVEIVHAQPDPCCESQSIFEYQVATQVTETNHIGPLLNGLPVRASAAMAVNTCLITPMSTELSVMLKALLPDNESSISPTVSPVAV